VPHAGPLTLFPSVPHFFYFFPSFQQHLSVSLCANRAIGSAKLLETPARICWL
jgi:hypothetical protein